MHHQDTQIEIARFGVAHGLKGQVKLHCFLEDISLLETLPHLQDGKGNTYRLHIIGSSKGQVIVKVEGCDNRTTAEGLRGITLYAPRTDIAHATANLGEVDNDTVFINDLIGAIVQQPDGSHYGEVVAVYDFGAGDILEIRNADGSLHMLTFTHANFPEIHLAEKRIICTPPDILAPSTPQAHDDGR